MEVSGPAAGSFRRPPADPPSAAVLVPTKPSSPRKKHCLVERLRISAACSATVAFSKKSASESEPAVFRGAGTDIEWPAASGRLTRKSCVRVHLRLLEQLRPGFRDDLLDRRRRVAWPRKRQPSIVPVRRELAKRTAFCRLLLQLKPLDLARGALRQVANKMNSRRRLKVAQTALAKAEQFPFVAAHPVPQDGERDQILADIAVGNAHCGASKTAGCDSRISSICLGAMFTPPLMINSFERPTTKK